MPFKRKQIGIRIPDCNVCGALTQYKSLISTSVPLWRDKVLNSGEAIHDYFDREIDLVLDIGILVSEPSTIVDLTGDEFKIVRQGKGEIKV